ncbi:hypothetical protein D3C87_1918080 [compost metagenome]
MTRRGALPDDNIHSSKEERIREAGHLVLDHLGNRKLLPSARHQNLHFIPFELAQQAFAQRRAGGDDSNPLPHQIDLQASCIRGQKQPLLTPLVVFQAEQCTDFNAALIVI